MTTVDPAPITDLDVFSALESEVRSYCRSWPAVFDTAAGSHLFDTDGRRYLDFFAGAGALNYGHNPPALRRALLAYLERGGITHGLDLHTAAKAEFLRTFDELVLGPRNLDYKVQFPGPTGANAVEAALKLARKVTGRRGIVSFTRGFHGMTLGALSVTGNASKRRSAGVPLEHTVALPYDGFLPGGGSAAAWLERMVADGGSGFETPAAVIVETTQGEGGLNPSSPEWLRELAATCRRLEILLIVDDVQMGVGRTGPFFSFELAGIRPDIVCLSKSISGYGLPMALVLLRPELDVWAPGEHNGTFRGNNPAFVTATAALREYWADDALERAVLAHGERVGAEFDRLARDTAGLTLRSTGRGLARGLAIAEPGAAERVCAAAWRRGLMMETAGPDDDVVKVMPPLTVTPADLDAGLDILAAAVAEVAA